MIVPLVAAFSASCSSKATAAPRPATSDGSMAARVTWAPAGVAGEPPASAGPAPPPTSAPTAATASHRGVRDHRGGRDHRPAAPVLLLDIDRLSLLEARLSDGAVCTELLGGGADAGR